MVGGGKERWVAKGNEWVLNHSLSHFHFNPPVRNTFKPRRETASLIGIFITFLFIITEIFPFFFSFLFFFWAVGFFDWSKIDVSSCVSSSGFFGGDLPVSLFFLDTFA